MTMPSNKWEEVVDEILTDLGAYKITTFEPTTDEYYAYYPELKRAKLALTNAVRELVETAKPKHVITKVAYEFDTGFTKGIDEYQANLLKAIGGKDE